MYLLRAILTLLIIKHAFTYNLRLSTQENRYELIPCTSHDDCEELDGKCINNFCNCNGTSNCIENSGVKVTKLGKSCNRNLDCNIDNSYCKSGKCSCKMGFVVSTNEKKCLKVPEGLGGKCVENIECSAKRASSICQENKCICMEQMHEYSGSCYKIVGLGEECALKEECFVTDHAICSAESKCECDNGFVSYKSRCLPIAKGVNSSCMENIQCTETLGAGSICEDGTCQCKEIYQVKSSTGKCVVDMLLNEKCMVHEDCHQPGHDISRLECIIGECKCKSTYTESDGHCLSTANKIASSLFLYTVMLLIRYV